MFGSYLVGLADITEILLLVLGLAALAVEIFIMPGTIVFGAIGFVSVVAAMILSQQTFIVPNSEAEYGLLTDNLLGLLLVTVGVVAAFAAYVKLLPHIPIMNRVLLTPPAAHQAGTEPGIVAPSSDVDARRGQVGVAATDLRPSGIIEFPDGARYDAVTAGEFVAAGSAVRVLRRAYQQLVVEQVREAGASTTAGERGQVSLGVLFLLVLVGLALIVAEVFFVSLGVLGGLAALSLLSAIVLAFTHHGQAVGFGFLLLAAIGAPVVAFFALKALPRTRFGRQLILTQPTRDEIGTAAPKGLEQLLRVTGVAESVLRPAGIARLDGRRVDVVTRGELIEAGTPVTVLAVEGSRIVVAAARDQVIPRDPP
jgi:membrane-bound ClpP family serine protease